MPGALHPQMKEILEMLAREGAGSPEVWEMTPAQARQAKEDGDAKHWNVDLPAVRQIIDREMPGARGPIPIRIYDPGAATESPCLIYFHGGGFVIGSIATHEGLCRRLALASGFRVISVGYRLAPEHKFPAPLEDCVAVIRWVNSNSQSLGIDRARIFVAGDSAGANLSLASAILLRDQNEPLLRGAVLIYGTFDVDFETPSYKQFGASGEYYLSTREMQWFWDHYLNGPEDRRNPLAVPLHAQLSGLPPLYVTGAEFDPLLDESMRLVERLSAIHAPHDWVLWRGVAHACINMSRLLEPAEAFLREIGEWLKRQSATQKSQFAGKR